MSKSVNAQKETDQAIGRLMDYVQTNEEWSKCFSQIQNEMVEPVASTLGIDLDGAIEELLMGPYEGHAFGYMFEETVTSDWNNQGSAIGAYLKKRGWREGPHGRQYLRALSDSDVKLWMTTDVSPGEWVEVRQTDEQSKPVRVYEKSASQQLMVGQFIAARVLQIGKKHGFSGAILPLTESDADNVQLAVDDVVPDTKALYQEMIDEKVIESFTEEELAQDIHNRQLETLTNTAFEQWALSVLSDGFTAPPEVRNTDDEAIVLTKHRMKVKGEVEVVQETLNRYFEPAQTNEWVWLNEQQRVIASIRLDNNKLEIESNSVERGERGLARLNELFGDAIGTPIGVHESLEQAIANRPVTSSDPTTVRQEELQNDPQVKAQLQEFLQKHYRDTLDQQIPALDNLTPRECAADPETREKVIHWLKNMELQNLKGGQEFETTWMWEELNLTDYR